jgi:predicted dehydrogenase
VVTGQLASGALFWAFTTETPWSERVEIYGSKGALIVDQLSDAPVRLYRGPDELTGEPVPGVAFDAGGWKNRSIDREGRRGFVDAVRRGEEPPVGAGRGRQDHARRGECLSLGERGRRQDFGVSGQTGTEHGERRPSVGTSGRQETQS